VIPERMQRRLNSAMGEGNAGRPISVNYAPVIHAVSSQGMADILRQHGEAISVAMRDELRRANL